MKKDKSKPTTSENLRRQAERRLLERDVDTTDMPVADINALIHELQVHQIELEMQNDELRRTQIELAESRDTYQELYDFAPMGYFTFDEKARIREVNLTGADLLGCPRSELLTIKFTSFISPQFQDEFYTHCKRLFETNTHQTCELKLIKQDGTPFFAKLDSEAVKDKSKNLQHIRTALADISEEVRATELVRESEKKLRQMFNQMVSASALTEIVFNRKGEPCD